MEKHTLSVSARERALRYLKELIAAKGVAGSNADACIELVKGYLNDFGIRYRIEEDQGYKTIMAGTGKILLNSHVDVVPAEEEHFTPVERDGYLYGRGSADALGCAVGMIVCAQECARQGKEPALMIVSDEELGGLYGTRYVLEEALKKEQRDAIRYAIVGEPTHSFGFSVREKGILRLRIDVRGKQGHPERSGVENAILTAARIITAIENSLPREEEGAPRLYVNPTHIAGGIASNVVPDAVSLEYDIRFEHGYTGEGLKQLITDATRGYPCTLTTIRSRSASLMDTEDRYFKLLDHIAGNPERITTNGASDYSFFYDTGIPGVVYGVEGGGWHTRQEFMRIESLYTYIENLITFMQEVDT